MGAPRIAIPAFLLATALGAQELAPESRPIRPDLVGKDVVFDRVRAICGDSVVTQSAAREGVLRTLRGSPTPLSPERLDELELRAVQEEVRTRLYAGLVRTLEDPNLVERRIDVIWQDYLKKQTEAAGSFTGLVKGLEQSGITIGQFEQDKRTEFMRDIYIHEMLRRKVDVENQRYVVTPAELREYYRIHKDQFVRPASADLVAVLVPRGRVTAQAEAEAVRAGLVAGKDPQAVKPADGAVTQWKGIKEPSAYQPEVRSFALSHQPGEVGGPFALEGYLAVVRIAARVEGRSGSFDDPSVQDEISRELRKQKLDRLQQQIARDRLLKAYIWPDDLLRR